jgi:glycosyltransferase involved in cell wall biosynthesis
VKIALITHEGGGIASVTYGLAANLARKGISTTVFAPVTGSQPQSDPEKGSFEVVRFPALNVPPRTIWYQCLNLRKFREMLKDYDVIHGMSPEASFMLMTFGNRFNRPFVGTIHGIPRAGQRAFVNQPISSWTLSDIGYHFLEFPFHELAINRILEESDHTTLCSFSVLEELKTYKLLRTPKISVIYNGIDLDEIEHVPLVTNDEDQGLSIIYAGRLFWYKGVMLLLEAFKNVRKDIKNAKLKIFGRGPLEGRIKKFIAESNLEKSVSFLGYIPHRTLLAELKKSDIVAFPSLSEAQPMFVLEAMACKKPVLMFDFPFAREIISDQNSGLIAKRGSVDDLCGKMSMLLSDDNLRRRLGENAYVQVKKRHNWDLQSEKYLQVYERVMDLA